MTTLGSGASCFCGMIGTFGGGVGRTLSGTLGSGACCFCGMIGTFGGGAGRTLSGTDRAGVESGVLCFNVVSTEGCVDSGGGGIANVVG